MRDEGDLDTELTKLADDELPGTSEDKVTIYEIVTGLKP